MVLQVKLAHRSALSAGCAALVAADLQIEHRRRLAIVSRCGHCVHAANLICAQAALSSSYLHLQHP